MSVVVLRALGLGDFLTGLPALRGLRRAFPEARVALAAPRVLEPLAQLSGAVDELVNAQPLEPIHVEPPDVAVNLHGSGPESHRVLLATRPRRLISFANADVPESWDMPVWESDEHEVDRWCRLLDASGIPSIPTQLYLRAPEAEPAAAAVGSTLIHPGATAASRRWPVERWAEVALAETASGHRVAVSAGPGETDLAIQVAHLAGLGREAVIAGDLIQLAAAIAGARIVASGDTGVAHMATALGTPSIVLFGPTPPSLWGPPSWHPHVVLWSGRRGDPHGDVGDEGLLEITSEQVVAALDSLGRRWLH
jgi:ADP-heptose:LPS heptosyltransferase